MNDQRQTPSTNGAPTHGQTALEIQERRFGQVPPPTWHEEQRAANRRTLAIVLTLMGGMAILGLVFALWTTPLRRANDTKARSKPPIAKTVD